jgi:sulfate adenylyltransferase subunit 1
LDEAVAPQSVILRLADDVDAARGSVIALAGSLPEARRELSADLFWLDPRPLVAGARVLVKHGTSTVQAIVSTVDAKRDLDTLEQLPTTQLEVNDIGRATLRLASALPVDDFETYRRTGAFLVINPADGATLAAGTVGK